MLHIACSRCIILRIPIFSIGSPSRICLCTVGLCIFSLICMRFGLSARRWKCVGEETNFCSFISLLVAGLDQAQIYDILATGKYNTQILNSVPQEVIQQTYDSFNTPAVGASGAIYGVLVAFGMMFPNIELMLIFLPIPIKAKYFIPVIILGDLFFGISGTSSGVAHWAHIGGALFGFIMTYYWKKNSFDNHRWN